MKNLLLICIGAISFTLAKAENVTQDKAAEMAKTFFANQNKLRSENTDIKLKLVWCGKNENQLRSEGITPSFYVFNRTDSPGFVIISGEDSTFPILGYSNSKAFKATDMPDNLSSLMNSYEEQIKSIRSNSYDFQSDYNEAWMHPERFFTNNQSLILTTAEWDQNDPYNSQCPMIDGQRTLTGCGATALAILLRYYGWPESAKVTNIEYITENSNIPVSVRLGDKYDWEQMPLIQPVNTGFNLKEKNEISKLMLHCGATFLMDYGINASWAYNYPGFSNAIEYFKLDPAVEFIWKNGYTEEEWFLKLKESLDNKEPVFYNSYSKYNKSEGHFFIIDGYDSNNMLHVNWGWGGYSNGFFTMNIEGGNDAVYVINQGALLSLRPNKNDNKSVINTLQFYQAKYNNQINTGLTTNGEIQPDKPFSLTAKSIWNNNPNTFNGKYVIALSDKNGTIKRILSEEVYLNLDPTYYAGGEKHSITIYSSELEPGDRIRAYSKGEGDSEWKWIRAGYLAYDLEQEITDEIILIPEEESGTSNEKLQIKDDIVISSNKTKVFIKSQNVAIKELLWYDISGNLIKKQKINTENYIEADKPVSNMAFILLQISTDKGYIVKKIK